MKRRVVITGMGMLTPLGVSVQETWQGIVAGNSGIRTIEHFDVSDYPTRFAGMVPAFDMEPYLSAKDARKMDSFMQYGLVAGIQAIADSGIEVTEANAGRIGAAIGSGIGGLTSIEENHKKLLEGGPRKISPFFVPGSIVNMVSGNLAIRYGFKGPNFGVVSACTSGAHNIGMAAQQIELGYADVMLAGGAEKASCSLGIGGFGAARALSTRNESPAEASRPWDKDRDGFVLADGAGVMVLEEYEHAKARGASIYAELIGFGMSDDAYHITAPAEGGTGAASAMTQALERAGLRPEQVDYINAHGTSTPAGDLAEAQAIHRVFGAYAKQLAVSSTKSMIGHLLGAAGVVEAIFSVLAIRDGIAPPTINLHAPSEGCDLNFVPNVAQERSIRVAMSNSFGFGGTNGSLIFKAP